VKLGLFKSLKDGGEDGVTPVDLASAHELHAPYVETWCKTACALELLDREDSARYRLAPFYESILASPGDPRYIGGMATLNVDFFHDDMSRYPEFFRTGSTNTFQEHGEELSACVMEVSGGLQTAVVHGLLPKLPEVGTKLKEGIRVLDMGCGGGGLMIRIAKANPNCSCVGVDVDYHGIELARTNIAKAGLEDRVSASLMDGGEIDFADEFELVTMFEVLHEIPLEVRPQVLANCYKALKPGGRLFILDETYPATVAESRGC
jgi:2-polyprenyl-3-methyl-5-hydroxy-6-metoxy-1,4-benzoquinol methylase